MSITINVQLSGLEELQQRLERIPQRGGVKAGIIETERMGSLEVLDYAPIQEFGGTIKKDDGTTIVIPPRPFMRTTYSENKDKWIQNFIDGIKRGVEAPRLFQLIGARMQEDIQKTIRSNIPPENSAATKKYKRINYPTHENDTLRMTDKMHNSIDFEVTS